MGRIKLIVTDLDGTFLSDFTTVSRENIEAVQAAQQQGVLVSACTTRNWHAAEAVVRRGAMEGVAACSNGAAFVRPADGNLLRRHCLPADGVALIVRESMRYGARLALHTLEDTFVVQKTAPVHFARLAADTSEKRPAVRFCEDVEQMLALAGAHTEMVEVVSADGQQMPKAWTKALQTPGLFHIANQNAGNYHITMRCASKLQAAQTLAQKLGLGPEEVMCLGDTYSDQAMIRWAGVGVAMANAEEGIKPSADYVTAARNDNGGFAEAVAKFVL